MKEGIGEALSELQDHLQENELNKTYNNLKIVSLVSSSLFLGYFLFVLPGSSVTLEDLNQYNWLNQGLINIKITVKDLILYLVSNPTNPGDPGNIASVTDNTSVSGPISIINRTGGWATDGSTSTITPNSSNLSKYFTTTKVEVSTQTVTNTVEVSTQTTSNMVNVSTQTVINTVDVGIETDINELIF